MNLVATYSPPRLLTAEEYPQLDEAIGFRDELSASVAELDIAAHSSD